MKNWLLLLLLLIPLLGVQSIYQLGWLNGLTHLGIAVALVTLLNKAQQANGWFRWASKFGLMGFYFCYLFFLLFEVLLFDFTAKGFTNEVYFHIELESLRVAFNEYPIHLAGFVLLLVLYVITINKLLKPTTRTIPNWLTTLAVFGVLVLTTNSALIRFATGMAAYWSEDTLVIDQNMIQRFKDVGVLTQAEITPTKALEVTNNPQAKNLILLYLESFNQGLLDSDRYPGLTPHLNQLSEQYQAFNHLSSSYVTIEGIISSQCGTMLPMTAGNNTFLNNGQLMSNLPCLGDVLEQAGYTQYYLGGAVMEFAGKGRFLELHGYDYIWGLEHWHEKEFKTPAGEWGLSDNVLFDQALDTIKKAAQNPPFNVTLLTLGTHAPGFVYAGCEPYQGSAEIFIQAIHCTDQLVGKFVAELDSVGLLDDAVLMIVADHGVFPTAKMKALFGPTADDRRLVGITNFPLNESPWPASSYDLAPTLLDMLGISHNAHFLFGQSLLKKTSDQQKYVTRYADWLDSKMVGNQPGACHQEEPLDWPLNDCQKNQLLNMTSQLLEHHSAQDPIESLACKLDIRMTEETNEDNTTYSTLWLNQENHFEHFHSDGFLLNSRRIQSGSFVFVLNDDRTVEQHLFFKPGPQTDQQLPLYVENIKQQMLIITTQVNPSTDPLNKEPDRMEVAFYQNDTQVQSKRSENGTAVSIDICQ